MAVRNDKMGQSWLLPPDISELIPADHICYLVAAIVNGMDVDDVEKKYRFKPGKSCLFPQDAAEAGDNGVY